MGYGKTYKTKWLEDLSGNQGTANQVLISTSAGIAWATASTVIGGPYLPLSGGTMTGNTTHGDNVRSLYGASSDMQIYHDGANSYVRDVGTGRLWIDSNGEGVSIISDGSGATPMAHFYKDGAVELYHNNVRRFRTNDLGGVSIDHTSGSMGNSFFGAVSGATNGFQIANSSSNEMTYTFQNGSNSQVLKILNNGNVGIGTTSPTTKLNVSGNIAVSSGSYLSFIDSNLSYNKIGRNTSAGGIQITTGGIATMNLLDNSNVGIGTTTPSEKLHVKGNILVEDNDSTDTVAQIGNSGDDGWLNLYANGTSKAFIGSNAVSYFNGGNVGIGTTSPDYQLEVEKTSAQATIGITGGATDARLHLKTNNGDWMLQNDYSNNGALSFYNSGHRLVVAKNGNVGIGTTNPSEKLEVNGNVKLSLSSSLYLGNSGEKITSPSNGDLELHSRTELRIKANTNNASGNSIEFYNGGTEKMRIASSGNVGIGTTSPSEKLEVDGNVKTSGTLTVNGTNITVANASNPYLFLNDTNGGAAIFQQSGNDTRIGSDSNTQVQFIQNNAVAVTISTSKNLGIGTTSPLAKTHISASGNLVIPALDAALGTATSLAIGNNGGTVVLAAGVSNTNVSWLQGRQGTGTGNAFNIALNPLGGNVGIGTTSPSSKLEVDGTATVNGQLNINGDATSSIRIGTGGTNAALIYSLTGDTLSIGANNATNLVCKTNKDVEFRGNLDLISNGALVMDNANNNNQMYIRNGGSNAAAIQFGHGTVGSSILMALSSDGKLGLGTTSPNASALLDVSSTTKGVLLPRMTTTQVNAISSPADGLTVYNTTLNTLCFYNGTSWQKVTSANM